MKKNEIRQLKVLKHLVEEYVKNAEAVSSRLLCEEYLPKVSSATVRIDLHKLEERNLIYQPHTSAGRIPTLLGYRRYLEQTNDEITKLRYPRREFLRTLLAQNYKDIPLALHYIKQLLAKETDQISFVAEPELAWGFLKKLDVFKIEKGKLLFVVSLDSGIDKTVILRCDYDVSEQQLRVLVRYINEELFGMRIYDVQQKLEKLSQRFTQENRLLGLFTEGLKNAFTEISNYFINFEGGTTFLEQPEFDDKSAIINFFNLMQRQDVMVNLLTERSRSKAPYWIVLGEEFGQPQWHDFVLIFTRYYIFDVPGYLGVVAPVRMDYKKNIPIVRDIARTITSTTKKGQIVPY